MLRIVFVVLAIAEALLAASAQQRGIFYSSQQRQTLSFFYGSARLGWTTLSTYLQDFFSSSGIRFEFSIWRVEATCYKRLPGANLISLLIDCNTIAHQLRLFRLHLQVTEDEQYFDRCYDSSMPLNKALTMISSCYIS